MSFKRAASIYGLWREGRWTGSIAYVATAMVVLGIIKS